MFQNKTSELIESLQSSTDKFEEIKINIKPDFVQKRECFRPKTHSITLMKIKNDFVKIPKSLHPQNPLNPILITRLINNHIAIKCRGKDSNHEIIFTKKF